jgi:hypothetical protein
VYDNRSIPEDMDPEAMIAAIFDHSGIQTTPDATPETELSVNEILAKMQNRPKTVEAPAPAAAQAPSREIFVFGSNRQGRHGAGAAKDAVNLHGAVYGQAEGLQGNAYGIITKELRKGKSPVTLDEVRQGVDRFLKFAAQNPNMRFNVTAIGTGLAGFQASDIAPLFVNAPGNVVLPDAFRIAQAPKSTGRPNFDKLPAYVPGQRTMVYAGVGSRETPGGIATDMSAIARKLAGLGYTLRSGGAEGADVAFEAGADANAGMKEIYRPGDATDLTRAIALEIHPNPKAISHPDRAVTLDLMARNTNQVFGRSLDKPVDFVLAWTPDAAETAKETGYQREGIPDTGGTAQAIRLASLKGIPVINMARPDWRTRLDAVLATPASAPAGAAFKSTIDSENRKRDAARLAQELPDLTEQGREDVSLQDAEGREIAVGYVRVVYGDHGPYIEMRRDQVNFPQLPKHKTKGPKAWYDEWRTEDGKVLVYEQKRDVSMLPNPPAGKYSVKNNRPEGYADYRVGMFYVSPDSLQLGTMDVEDETRVEARQEQESLSASALAASQVQKPDYLASDIPMAQKIKDIGELARALNEAQDDDTDENDKDTTYDLEMVRPANVPVDRGLNEGENQFLVGVTPAWEKLYREDQQLIDTVVWHPFFQDSYADDLESEEWDPDYERDSIEDQLAWLASRPDLIRFYQRVANYLVNRVRERAPVYTPKEGLPPASSMVVLTMDMSYGDTALPGFEGLSKFEAIARGLRHHTTRMFDWYKKNPDQLARLSSLKPGMHVQIRAKGETRELICPVWGTWTFDPSTLEGNVLKAWSQLEGSSPAAIQKLNLKGKAIGILFGNPVNLPAANSLAGVKRADGKFIGFAAYSKDGKVVHVASFVPSILPYDSAGMDINTLAQRVRDNGGSIELNTHSAETLEALGDETPAPEEAFGYVAGDPLKGSLEENEAIATLKSGLNSPAYDWSNPYIAERTQDFLFTEFTHSAGLLSESTVLMAPWMASGGRGLHWQFLDKNRARSYDFEMDALKTNGIRKQLGMIRDVENPKRKVSGEHKRQADAALRALGIAAEMGLSKDNPALSDIPQTAVVPQKVIRSRWGDDEWQTGSGVDYFGKVLQDGDWYISDVQGPNVRKTLADWDAYVAEKQPGMPKWKDIWEQVKDEFDDRRSRENEMALQYNGDAWIHYMENYILHQYLKTDMTSDPWRKKFLETSNRVKARKFLTYEEAAWGMGLLPRTTNILDLLDNWDSTILKTSAYRNTLNMGAMTTSADGAPTMIPLLNKNFEGETILTHAALRNIAENMRDYINMNVIAQARVMNKPVTEGDLVDVDSSKDISEEIRRLWDKIPHKDLYLEAKCPFDSVDRMYVVDKPAQQTFDLMFKEAKVTRLGETIMRLNQWQKFMSIGFPFTSFFHPASLLESWVAAEGLEAKWIPRSPALDPASLLGAPQEEATSSFHNVSEFRKDLQRNPRYYARWLLYGMQTPIGNPDRMYGYVERDIESAATHAEGKATAMGAEDAEVSKFEKLIGMNPERSKKLWETIGKRIRWFQQVKNNWDHWLWQDFQPVLKLWTAEKILWETRASFEEHEIKWDPDIEADVMEQISGYTNDAYGGQEWGRYLWANPNALKWLHLILFAPDWCAFSDTRVMTKTGFKYHYEISIGDEILIFDPKTQTTRWSPLKDKYVREDYSGDMICIRSRGNAHEIGFTPAHTCYLQKKDGTTKVVKAEQLKDGDRIPRCASHVVPIEKTVRDKLVVLAGWLVTDGYIKHKQHSLVGGKTVEYRYGRIVQSKPAMVERLKSLGLKFYSEQSKDHDAFHSNYDKYVFTIPVVDFEELERLGVINGKMSWEFMSRLTKEQLELLEETMMLGDGTGQNRFCGQEDECFQMSLLRTMLGKPVTFYEQKQKGQWCWRTRAISSKIIECSKTTLKTRHYQGGIWCPSVETGFWVAERKGIIFITGNTISAANSAGITSLPGIRNIIGRELEPITKDQMLMKSWPGTVAWVLLALPNALQLAAYMVSRLTPWADDDDVPFTVMNEPGRQTHIDVTPLLRPFRMVPAVGYEGGDTQKRRVYMRWGKQAYEVLEGWIAAPVATFFAKTSMMVKQTWEQATGYNTSLYELPFRGEGAGSLFGLLSAEGGFGGSRAWTAAKHFLPMSATSILEGKPSGFIAPVSRGASMSRMVSEIEAVLKTYARRDVWDKLKGRPKIVNQLEALIPEVIEKAEKNGYNVEELVEIARGAALAEAYRDMFAALDEGSQTGIEAAAERAVRLNAKTDGMIQSIKRRRLLVNRTLSAEEEGRIKKAGNQANYRLRD